MTVGTKDENDEAHRSIGLINHFVESENGLYQNQSSEFTTEGNSLRNNSIVLQHGKDFENVDRKSSSTLVASSTVNLCSAILGVGILSTPYAFSKAGIVGSSLMLIIAAASTHTSIDMLIQSCSTKNIYSYEHLTVQLFGKFSGWFVEFCVFSFCFGICVAYLVAVGDILEQLVLGNMNDSHSSREIAMIVFWAIVMFPLSLFEKTNSLRFTSFLGISSVFLLVVAVLYHSISTLMNGSPIHHNTDLKISTIALWPQSIVDFFLACPIVIFSFNCQTNVPAIFEELEIALADRHEYGEQSEGRLQHTITNSNMNPMIRVSKLAIGICFIAYTLTGIFSYIEFTSLTQANVLKNYCVQITHDKLMIVAFLGIVMTIVAAFPMNVLPSRATLDIILSRQMSIFILPNEDSENIHVEKQRNDTVNETVDLEYPTTLLEEPLLMNVEPSSPIKIWSMLRHFLLTFIICVSALFVAIVVPDISIIFGLMGGVASSTIGFIMPAAFYLKLDLANLTNENNITRLWYKAKAWGLIVGGTIIGVMSTAVTVQSIFHSEEEDAGNNVEVCPT